MQLTYDRDIAAAHEGMTEGTRSDIIESYAAEGVVNFGVALVAGTDVDTQVKGPAAAGSLFRGISISTWALEQAGDDGFYADTSSVNVMRRGVVWVEVVDDVVTDDSAFFVTNGANAGLFTSTSTEDTDTDIVPTGIFRTSAAAGELAKLEINLPAANHSNVVLVASGIATALTGATYDVTIAGVLATDIVVITVAALTIDAYPTAAVAGAGKITLTWNTDPGAHSVNYMITRLVSQA